MPAQDRRKRIPDPAESLLGARCLISTVRLAAAGARSSTPASTAQPAPGRVARETACTRARAHACTRGTPAADHGLAAGPVPRTRRPAGCRGGGSTTAAVSGRRSAARPARGAVSREGDNSRLSAGVGPVPSGRRSVFTGPILALAGPRADLVRAASARSKQPQRTPVRGRDSPRTLCREVVGVPRARHRTPCLPGQSPYGDVLHDHTRRDLGRDSGCDPERDLGRDPGCDRGRDFMRQPRAERSVASGVALDVASWGCAGCCVGGCASLRDLPVFVQVTTPVEAWSGC